MWFTHTHRFSQQIAPAPAFQSAGVAPVPWGVIRSVAIPLWYRFLNFPGPPRHSCTCIVLVNREHQSRIPVSKCLSNPTVNYTLSSNTFVILISNTSSYTIPFTHMYCFSQLRAPAPAFALARVSQIPAWVIPSVAIHLCNVHFQHICCFRQRIASAIASQSTNFPR